MVIPGLGHGKYKINLEYFMSPESKKILKKRMGICQKTSPEGTLIAKSRTIWAAKWIMIVLNFNLHNKIKISESILIVKEWGIRDSSSL